MDEAALIQATHLSKRELRYVLHDILEGEAAEGDLLVIGLFDTLQALKFNPSDVTTILRHFRDPLRRLGTEYAQVVAGKQLKSKLVMLHVINNRYFSVDGEDGFFDIKELEVVTLSARPFVGIFVVLPELFWRLKRALEVPRDGHSTRKGSSVLQGVGEDD